LAQQTLAFSMMVYACKQVHHIAQNNPPSNTASTLEAYIDATVNMNPQTCFELFNRLDVTHQALLWLQSLLSGKKVHPVTYKETAYSQPEYLCARQSIMYSQGAIKLKGFLFKNKEKLDLLENRLQVISRYRQLQTEESIANPQVISKMASLYIDIFGDLAFRIIVQGAPEALKHTATVEQIRSLLLGAIRFTVLWEQVGGRKWKLLLQRGKLLRKAKELTNVISKLLPEYSADLVKIKP
tara:strand:- start:349 stop:1068 length:720 start_codon:yes stop_codon:yes gene_type:complete